MNLDVVIVTFNRLEKLKKALISYEKQSCQFRNLIVVNNHSSDGTASFLEEWEDCKSSFSKIVITAEKNLGGAGGFFLGQKKALELDADWVYVADDDAYADTLLFQKFYNFIDTHNNEAFSAVCASVRDNKGNVYCDHRGYLDINKNKSVCRRSSVIEDYSKSFFSIDLLSYVGSFINVNAINAEGLVNPDYFIYFDDSEHSLRIKRFGKIVCVPDLIVIHDCDNLKPQACKVSWRDYYLSRNNFHMLLHHMPFLVVMRLLLSFLIFKGKKISSSREYRKVYRDAIHDAIFGRLGVHKIYKPGWQIE